MVETKLNSSLKLIAKTSLIVLIGLILSKLATYIYRIIIARYYGSEAYGQFSLGLMIFSIFIAIASLGLIEGIIRFIPIYRGKNENHKINYLIKFALSLSLFCGILASVILYFSANSISLNIFHNAELAFYLKIFAITIPIFLIGNIYLYVLRAYEEIGSYSFILNILQNIVKLAFILLFILLGFKAGNAIVYSYSFGILAVLVASYLLCKYKIPTLFIDKTPTPLAKIKIRTELVSYSWPIIFLGIISNILYWIDSFSIGYFKSVNDVGLYNAAVPIAALFTIAPDIFMQLFFPVINKEYGRKNIDLIKSLSKQVTKWIFIIDLPLFFLVLLFPGAIINPLFGYEYLVASNSLRFLALGAFISSVLGVSYYLVSMAGKSKVILANTIVFSLVNLAINILLVPKYGMNGASIATMISGITGSLVILFLARKYTSIFSLDKSMLKIFAVSLIPLAIMFILRSMVSGLLSLILTGVLFGLSYLLIIFLTKCLDKSDAMIISSVKNKLFGKR